MGYDYALVHLKFTVPLAAILTIVNYPFVTRRHWYQTAILVTIAVVATIPWDSYLIRQKVWTYPPDAIIGPTFWSIPAEELFFFFIQTYITCQLYGLVNKPLLHAEYLVTTSWIRNGLHRLIQVLILDLALVGFWLVSNGGPGTYMGLILIWACPFALLTWSLGGLFMVSLPQMSIVNPILVSTLYLWIVDEGALQRGTWAIESGTKLGVTLAGSLEIEEAVFFLATNCLIVFGMGAFDNALAIIDAFPDAFEKAPECPSPAMLIEALFMPWTEERKARIHGIQEAVQRLCKKSRSFYLASSTFTGRLRIDLILLYSYCRMADDLVDEPPEGLHASTWISKLNSHLDLVYKPKKDAAPSSQADLVRTYIEKEFPVSARSALRLLPTTLLPSAPLYGLLEGFKTDAKFRTSEAGVSEFPIKDEESLHKYGSQVAGTVGQLCMALISHHSKRPIDSARGKEIAGAAGRMGVALQYVNIARDIAVDTTMGRVYLPTTWLEEEGWTPEMVVDVITKSPGSLSNEKEKRQASLSQLVSLRRRLLNKAFKIYAEARPIMDWLPAESRRPMIVAVESYMEIGRVLLEKDDTALVVTESGRPRRATVPKTRRLRVALKAMLYA
ncbi:hypothetical protein N0V82_004830 [Gnomoniopsis sp. IMI 355080]|nr:hypothetical protein N0V82_004830 [Gnomoniopsis sp. IMI 355080]